MPNLIFGIVFFLFCYVRAQECLTPTNKTGICMKITECNTMKEILNFIKHDPFTLQYNYSLQLLKDLDCDIEDDAGICCEKTDDFPKIIPSTLESIPEDVTNHTNLGLLDHHLCGVYSDDKMLTQSHKTGVFDYPWMALIKYKIEDNDTDSKFLCGGTIINKRYILTAAHCVTSLPSTYTVIGVRVGEHDISKPVDCDLPDDPVQRQCTEGFQEFSIESIHFHPEFSLKRFQNDIALLKLNQDINFGPENIRPICLPFGSALKVYGNEAILTGWGTAESGPQNPDLLLLKTSLIPNDECFKIYNQTGRIIGYKQICTGEEKDLQIGDSGGPLQIPGIYYNRTKYVQYGIVSYGFSKSGVRNFPGVYTSVSYYVNWILNTIEE